MWLNSASTSAINIRRRLSPSSGFSLIVTAIAPPCPGHTLCVSISGQNSLTTGMRFAKTFGDHVTRPWMISKFQLEQGAAVKAKDTRISETLEPLSKLYCMGGQCHPVPPFAFRSQRERPCTPRIPVFVTFLPELGRTSPVLRTTGFSRQAY